MKKSTRILLLCLLAFITVGVICDHYYRTSPHHAIKYNEFQSQLLEKQVQADNTLQSLKNILTHTSSDSLINYPFPKNDITYYVFENNKLSFWSDNNLAINNISLSDSTNWQYIQLPNAHCISRVLTIESKKIVAVVSIKNSYPYENDELVNNFATAFEMNKLIELVDGDKTDKFAVFSSNGHYLFSLLKPEEPIYIEAWSTAGLVALGIAFLLFFFLYARTPLLFNKKSIPLKYFVGLSLGVALIIGLGLFFNIPSLLLANKLFTAFQYASNPLLSSICHLTIATGYLFSTIYLFYFHVDTENNKKLLIGVLQNLFFLLYFILVYYLLIGLIYHSSIQINILGFNDFSAVTIWIHFLILFWGIGLALLFFKSYSWFHKTKNIKAALITDLALTALLFIGTYFLFPISTIRICISFTAIWLFFYIPFLFPKHKNIYGSVTFWTFVFSLFVVINSVSISNTKKNNKYKILAQNISINGNSENDRMADILLEELDMQLKNDNKIGLLLNQSDSLMTANDYLNKVYFRGFWNKYEIRLDVAAPESEIDGLYKSFITSYGTRIKKTHFYSILANENNLSYIGKFITKTTKKDSVYYFMQFYARSQFKSYSFPNLLIPSSPDIQSQLNISIAKYEHNKLVYSSGKINLSPSSDWIPNNNSDFLTTIHNDRKHYIYSPTKGSYIIITEMELHDPFAYLLYFLYTFLAYFVFCILVVWIFRMNKNNEDYRPGLTAKFQYAFILLLIVSFILIFYVSVNFIQKKYQEEQIANLESKKNYIQKSLQDMYYWNQVLTEKNIQDLNFDLQDLSYLYHTDILVYDNQGVLVGSSQPRIFNKNLISNRIAPKPYFTLNANLNQYEHIGKLNYLTAYTDFYNGDFLQIGYIAVPQFFSQDEIRAEIKSFLAVIIHIYLIISILAILISLFIGKQLSSPLIVLENKLKEMRLGTRNEKVDYKLNDEIGQLVLQYNKTVDELEQSAKLLAKSERESAWKSMARQVAHEINNPLTPMKLTIQQLQRTKSMNDERFDDYFKKSTVMLIEQIDNLSRIAGTFSDFARMPEASFERVDIAARLHSVVQLFSNNYEKIQLNYLGIESNVFVYADPEQLVQVFNNLLKNAIQAIPMGRLGVININLAETREHIMIKINDNGIGIEVDAYDRLFVPNFTTKNNGMGLGLAIAKNIIEISGGTVAFTSILNEQTTFIITLPKA